MQDRILEIRSLASLGSDFQFAPGRFCSLSFHTLEKTKSTVKLYGWLAFQYECRFQEGLTLCLFGMGKTLRLLNALNSEDRGLKVRSSLATIAFNRESAQLSQILSSQGKNAPSDPYPHYLVRSATSRDGVDLAFFPCFAC